MKTSQTIKKEIGSLKQARADCIAKFGLTEDLYELYFFETGCLMVEYHTQDDAVSSIVLQSSRFWMWWRLQYLLNDKNDASKHDYVAGKSTWITSEQMKNLFINYLQYLVS